MITVTDRHLLVQLDDLKIAKILCCIVVVSYIVDSISTLLFYLSAKPNFLYLNEIWFNNYSNVLTIEC